MKTRRIISILLSVCMLLSVAGIAASAATTAESAGAADLTIAATSNIGATTTQTVDSTSGQVTVTYYVNTDAAKLLNIQWTLTYDEEYLAFDTTNGANLSYSNNDIDDVDEYFMMPVANGDGVFNFGRTGEVLANTSDLGKYDLTASGNKVAIAEVKFVPKKAGSTTVNLDVEVAQVVKTGATDEITLIKNSAFVDESVDLAATAAVTTGSEESVYDENLKFYSANIAFANSLEIKFYVKKSIADNYTDLKVTFSRDDFRGFSDDRTVTAYTEASVNNTPCYAFSFVGLNPQLVGDKITASISGRSVADGKIHDGKSREYSALDYAFNTLNYSGSTDKTKTMIVDLLYYAAAAQTYSHYNESNLVTKNLTDAQKAYKTTTPHAYTDLMKKDSFTGRKVKFTQASAVFGSSIGARFYFTKDNTKDNEINMEDVVVKVKVGARSDAGVYEFSDFTDEGNGSYSILFDKAFASELSDKMTAIAYDKSGNQVSDVLYYSIETYVARSNTSDPVLRNLYDSMMNYGYSVMAYANKTPIV